MMMKGTARGVVAVVDIFIRVEYLYVRVLALLFKYLPNTKGC